MKRFSLNHFPIRIWYIKGSPFCPCDKVVTIFYYNRSTRSSGNTSGGTLCTRHHSTNMMYFGRSLKIHSNARFTTGKSYWTIVCTAKTKRTRRPPSVYMNDWCSGPVCFTYIIIKCFLTIKSTFTVIRFTFLYTI